MTIEEYIINATLESVETRRDKLIALQAPAILIKSIDEELGRLRDGELKCGGDVELLQEEFVSVEQKKGKGGIPYFTFNGDINYFPKAKYGRFVAKGEVK